jgi:hypothetical protein
MNDWARLADSTMMKHDDRRVGAWSLELGAFIVKTTFIREFGA